jgi:endonuclease-3 related protein
MKKTRDKKAVLRIYDRLLKAFGPQHWWPGDTAFEVMVGAILTQNTNWRNVEKAINQLKRHRCLSVSAIDRLPQDRLGELIKPSGFFNIKAKRLKNFTAFLLQEYDGRISRMKRKRTQDLRRQMLAVNGLGPETVDSILLYALQKPVFVVDAYTKRIFSRHHMVGAKDSYDVVQDFFMCRLTPDVVLFNEYHALIVRLGKDFCRNKPLCAHCPLASLL